MVWIHPRTRQRVVTAKNNTDIILPLQGQEGLSQEELTVIGGWKDFTGSGGAPTKQLMYGAGLADELFGTDAWVNGARKKNLGVLGEVKPTTRLRQRQEHIIFTN